MKNKKGFTLIETLTAAIIVGIMSTVIFVGIGRNRNEKELESSARELASAIREAQNNALNGKIIDTTKTPCSYTFSISDAKNYKSFYNHKDPSSDNCLTPAPIPSPAYVDYSTKNGVTISPTNLSINFSIPNGNVTFIPSATSVDITLSKSSSSYHVCVGSFGNIYEQKNACP